jgi:phospholipase C
MLTRRTFLHGAAATAGVAMLRPLEFAAAKAARVSEDQQRHRSHDAPFDTVVVVMMENRSFDHFLGWLPGADGRQAGLRYRDLAGKKHSTHDLGSDVTGCGNTDPDHSWYGGLVQLNGGRNDGWLKTPRRSLTDTYPIGYYTESSLPVLGALARNYATPDRYFCSLMAETFPNRLYMHSAQTDRDHNILPPSIGGPPEGLATLPTIWDRLATAGLSGRYYFGDLPFLGLWGPVKYLPIFAPFAAFLADAAAGTLPNVSFVDPKFTNDDGPESDQHPLADVRVGEKLIADVFHAIRTSPQWHRTVLVFTYDEWGGFFDHVPPPKVADDTDPAAVKHACNVAGTCTEPPGLLPDYHQLGFRVPCVVVSPFSPSGPVEGGPFEHTSILRMIEWRWGLEPLTTRDRKARNLVEVLDFEEENRVPDRAVPSTGPFAAKTCP